MSDWKAHVLHDFVLGVDRLWLGRHRHDETTEWLAGDGTWRVTPNNVSLPHEELIAFPQGALAALADAVKPGPTEELVDEVRASLAIERARVDRILLSGLPAITGDRNPE